MDIIFATKNKGKLREVNKILADTNFVIRSLDDFSDAPAIIEDASTFEGNALIKVKTVFDEYRLPVIGDDSGLAVEQLNGAPGVYSARYAGENCTYEDNNCKMIEELKKYPHPHPAKFICCAAYYNGGQYVTATGELKGNIITEFRGTNGFGYDPIFIPEGYDISMAEMSAEDKNKISHRGRAFSKLKSMLVERNLL
jgi:XTP/dITP diphosphohydrolase